MSTERTAAEERSSSTADGASDDAIDDPEDREVVELDHAPPRLMQGIASGAALLGTALAAPFALISIPFGLAGLVIVVASVFVTYSVGWLTFGTGLILVAALISGMFGVLPPELILLSVGATIIGWDAGQYGIGLGEQLGRQTHSRRSQIVHVAANTLVIGLVSTLVYLVYLFGGDGRPAPAVSIVVIGVIIVAWVLRS